jgi:hypothetical protein
MYTFQVRVDTENAAFDEGNGAPELARILRKVADELEAHGVSMFWYTIRDIDGNDVGRYALTRTNTTRV